MATNAETLTSSGVASDTLLDLESVNNLSFDDMESAPGFITPPDGIYDINLSSAKIEKRTAKEGPNKGQEKASINHMFKILKTHELSNSADQIPPAGSMFSIRFQINEMGLKFWKSQTKDILGEGAQGSNLTVAAVLKELSGGTYSFKARIKGKDSPIKDANGNDTGKKFTNLQVQVLSPLVNPSLEGGEVTTDAGKI